MADVCAAAVPWMNTRSPAATVFTFSPTASISPARVRTRDEGQRGLARVRAAADVDVDGIHANGSQANDHLIGTGNRLRDILELQHLGAAMLSNDDSSHGAMLS